MNRSHLTTGAILLGLLAPTYAQPVQAEEFTGRDLLREPIDSQHGFLSTSISMASAIAGQIDPAKSECISKWYWDDPRGRKARGNEVLGVIRQIPDYHPALTLVALIEKACGEF